MLFEWFAQLQHYGQAALYSMSAKRCTIASACAYGIWFFESVPGTMQPASATVMYTKPHIYRTIYYV